MTRRQFLWYANGYCYRLNGRVRVISYEIRSALLCSETRCKNTKILISTDILKKYFLQGKAIVHHPWPALRHNLTFHGLLRSL